jgi:hypothetical protein
MRTVIKFRFESKSDKVVGGIMSKKLLSFFVMFLVAVPANSAMVIKPIRIGRTAQFLKKESVDYAMKKLYEIGKIVETPREATRASDELLKDPRMNEVTSALKIASSSDLRTLAFIMSKNPNFRAILDFMLKMNESDVKKAGTIWTSMAILEMMSTKGVFGNLMISGGGIIFLDRVETQLISNAMGKIRGQLVNMTKPPPEGWNKGSLEQWSWILDYAADLSLGPHREVHPYVALIKAIMGAKGVDKLNAMKYIKDIVAHC